MVNLIRAAERGLRRRASSLIRGAEAIDEADVEMALHPFRQVAGELEGAAERLGAGVAEEIGEWASAGRVLAGTVDFLAPEVVAGTAVAAYGAKRFYDIIERTVKKRKKNSGASESTARQPQEPGSRRTPRRHGPADPPAPRPPMPPRGVSTATHWYDRTKRKWIKRKRPLRSKKTSYKKKSMKKRTVRKAKRTYKKKTVKRKFMRATGSTKYNVHGIISREHVNYFGFQANGGRDEFLFAAADAILRSWAGKFNCGILSPDQAWVHQGPTDIMPRSYQIYYRRNVYDLPSDANIVGGTRTTLVGTLHKSMCDTLAAELRSKARDGYVPYYVAIWNHATADSRIYDDNKFGDMLVNITSSMTIKLRNITHNDEAGGDMTEAQKNPLMGYAYQFKGEVPLAKQVLLTATGGDMMRWFHHRDNDRGICFGPQSTSKPQSAGQADGRDDDDGLTGQTVISGPVTPFKENEYMHEPPVGSTVFSNCYKSHKVVMPVGREMRHTIKAAFKGTLAGLMLKYVTDRYRPAHIGNCFWLGLRQKFRNAVTITNDGTLDQTNHERVSIEYDVDTVIRSGARFAAATKTPAEVNVKEMNVVQHENPAP